MPRYLDWGVIGLRLLILSFRGALEALQGTFYARTDNSRAECLEQPTPPARWEDEVSAILDAAGRRIDGMADYVRFLFQPQREEGMAA